MSIRIGDILRNDWSEVAVIGFDELRPGVARAICVHHCGGRTFLLLTAEGELAPHERDEHGWRWAGAGGG